jgi:Icc-related predicted phosphoesterase
MKLHILSDLHTEFASFSAPDTGADVVILAGDIGVGLDGIQWAASQFPKVPVIYVPGNHEYYDHDIALIDELVKHSPPNIHVLNNDKIVLNGVRFLGSTLWTDFKLYGEGAAWFSRQRAKRSIEDFASIWKISLKSITRNCGYTGTHTCPATTSFSIHGSSAIREAIRLKRPAEDFRQG